MGNIVEFKNLYKNYNKNKVLEDINLFVPEGKFTVLIGCNGAGKSTTLRLIAGEEISTKGEIKVFNENPYEFNFSKRKDIFFIHEHHKILSDIPVLDLIKIYRSVFPKWDNKLFNKMGKERKISFKKPYSSLSRGQKMQFLLMVALASKLKVLLLDEITSVIDIDGQRYFLDLLKSFTNEGGTVLLTTNILSEVNGYADHLILLQDTKLKICKDVSDIQKDFIILNKISEHPVFSEGRIGKIRSGGYEKRQLFIVPIDLTQKYSDLEEFKTDLVPQLEDILVYNFKFKESYHDEELVA